MKKFLAASMCAVVALGSAFAFASCADNSANGKDFSEEIAELQQQIQELENKNNSLQSELNSLKNNSGNNNKDYTAEINSLKQQIKTLETKLSAANTQISNSNTSITQLKNDLESAKLRLDAVEGAMQADKNYTYNMGDVCTVKSASGIELYKVRLIKYDFLTGSDTTYRLYLNIQRLNLPSYLSLNQFANFAIYDDITDSYVSQFTALPSFADTSDSFEQVYTIGFMQNIIPTHIFVGLPWDNDFSDNASRQYILPYAVYENK